MFYENRKNDIFLADYPGRGGRLAPRVHLHYHIEVVYVYEGNARVSVNSVEHELPEDSLLFVFPNHSHGYTPNGNSSHLIFIVNPDLFPEFSGIFDRMLPVDPVLTQVSSHPRLLRLLRLLMAEAHETEDPYSRSMAKGLVGASLSQIFRHMEMYDRLRGNSSQALNTVISFCARNFSRELSLEVLSEELHMSKYYISHLFSNRFHMKFNDYINSLRVSAACRYLCNTDKSITEISELVGFSTPRTFNRAFLKHFQKSPTAYRQESRAAISGERAEDIR